MKAEPFQKGKKDTAPHFKQSEMTSLTVLAQRKHLTVKEAKEILQHLGLKLHRELGTTRRHTEAERKILREREAFAKLPPRKKRLAFATGQHLPFAPRPMKKTEKKWLTPPQVELFLREFYRRVGARTLARFF